MTELANLHTERFKKLVIPIARITVQVIFSVFGPIRVRGAYRMPKEGGVLILANHLADIDPIVTSYASPRPIYFMAKSELFGMKVLGGLLRYWKAFSVKRGEADRESIKRAVDLLKAGNVVCVYPEGQLSETGELQELKPGVALIIRMAQVPVMCLGMRNTNRVMPYGTMVPRPALRTIPANWGEPHQFAKDATTEDIMAWAEGQLRELTDQTTY